MYLFDRLKIKEGSVEELELEYEKISRKIAEIEEEKGTSLGELLKGNQEFFALLQKAFSSQSLKEKERAADLYQSYMGKILALARKGEKETSPESEALVAGALGALRKSRLDPGSFPQ